MIDILARELKMDPAEIRMKNFVHNDEFPFPTATGLMYDSGDYSAPLKMAMEMVDYPQLRKEQAEARKQGRHRERDIGQSGRGGVGQFGAVNVPSP